MRWRAPGCSRAQAAGPVSVAGTPLERPQPAVQALQAPAQPPGDVAGAVALLAGRPETFERLDALLAQLFQFGFGRLDPALDLGVGAFQAGECGVALVGLALDTPQADGHTMDVRRTVQPPCPYEPHTKRSIRQARAITGM